MQVVGFLLPCGALEGSLKTWQVLIGAVSMRTVTWVSPPAPGGICPPPCSPFVKVQLLAAYAVLSRSSEEFATRVGQPLMEPSMWATTLQLAVA
ncbi:hypothetical protein DYQ48_07210 [Xanthomonas hortorum]|nr:hypothetical protein BI317_16630 [Xanthomonas hortorum pv. gardneri]ASW44582.1 hypothetical protein XJ27_00310 [Xanthomonas hortorum]QEW14804.1 hypothetical protein DYQ48_07210 [Xanthomonas hortorum]